MLLQTSLNAVGGIDECVWPSRLQPALRQAAERVEPVLPETGVCHRSAALGADNCCGGPALSGVDACCVADANARQQGKTGCGCAS